MGALKQHGIPDQILTDNGKVFTGKLARKPAIVLFDRICHENGIKHILTAPYSPTTTGKVERLHKTIRKEFLADKSFDTLEQMQAALDAWVIGYNTDRDNQAIGDVPPIRRFELARPSALDVVDGEIATQQDPEPAKKFVTRRVDDKGRISILEHRYHVGRYLAGQSVTVTVEGGLLNIAHNGVIVATHARRHLQEDDERMVMDRRSKATRPARPTKGDEVFRRVDLKFGALSFAGTSYRSASDTAGCSPA